MSVRREPQIGIARETGVTQYDLLLATLPIPLLLGVLGATLSGVSLSYGAGVGALLSAPILAYGLFVAGPTDPISRTHGRNRGGYSSLGDD